MTAVRVTEVIKSQCRLCPVKPRSAPCIRARASEHPSRPYTEMKGPTARVYAVGAPTAALITFEFGVGAEVMEDSTGTVAPLLLHRRVQQCSVPRQTAYNLFGGETALQGHDHASRRLL